MSNINTLKAAWTARKHELRAMSERSRLAEASEHLYQLLVDPNGNGIAPNLEKIRADIERMCHTATVAGDLRVPLWNYKQRKFLRTVKEDHALWGNDYDAWVAHRESLIAMYGYHATVDSIPVWKIIFNTNILDRLTVALFGTTNFTLHVQRINTFDPANLGFQVSTYTMFVKFHPNGLTIQQADLSDQIYRTPPSTPNMTSVPPAIRRPTGRFVYDADTSLSRELLDDFEDTLSPGCCTLCAED